MNTSKQIFLLAAFQVLSSVAVSYCQESPDGKDTIAEKSSTTVTSSAQKETKETPRTTASASSVAQEVPNSEPVVARVQMKLTLKGEVIDTIQKGDLLTVLAAREESYVIRTFNGHKGAVAKTNVSLLAESVRIYDELIRAEPGDGRLHTLRANAAWAVGDTAKALADYDEAIELGYTEAHAYSTRGLFHSAMGEFEKAVDDYSIAIEKDPSDSVPLVNRASVYMTTGKYSLAIDDYTLASKLGPDNPTLYNQRAIAHKLLGKLDAAVADYDRAIELADKDVSAWMGRGFVKFQQGNHKAAIEDFSQVIDLSPQTAVAFNNRGYNHQQIGNLEDAAKDYQRAVELAPKYLLALQNRGWLLTIAEDEELRDPIAAIKTATSVCEITEFKDFSDLTLLAASYASAGEFDTAIGWQEKAVGIASDSQKDLARQILELYQSEEPIDPKLLEDSSEDHD